MESIFSSGHLSSNTTYVRLQPIMLLLGLLPLSDHLLQMVLGELDLGSQLSLELLKVARFEAWLESLKEKCILI